ncbi:MAG: hypothetical protein J2O46_10480, partial [Nocardioides sp.]|nr:hypothetical protein [Nocardioides sp.]
QQPVPGGTGAGFSVGGDLMAVIDDEEEGVETWHPASHSIQDGGLGRTGLEQRQVRGVGLDPTGATMVVSTQSSAGSSLLWYADVLHPDDRRPSIAATIPVPSARTRLLLSGQTLAAGDATSTDLFRAMDGHPDQRRHASLTGAPLAVSPDDGDDVATLDKGSGKVSLWDTTQLLPVAWQKGEKPDQTVPLSPTATMSCAIGTPTSAAFGPDGRTLAVGCSDGEVDVWKVN